MDKPTLTVGELRKLLILYPDSAKVYLSSDSEGNSYATMAANDSVLCNDSIDYASSDNVVVFMPWHEGLDFADIAPITNAKDFS